MSAGIFKSSARRKGDLAGVFEYDGEVGYFYLYDMSRERGKQIVGAIPIISGQSSLLEFDIDVRWNNTNNVVGLFIHERLWAVFEQSGQQYGGHYSVTASPSVPNSIISAF